MIEKLKGAGTLAIGIVVVLILLALPAIFINGVAWASQFLLPPLFTANWIILAVVLFIFLPLSLFRRLRSFTGSVILLSSYVFGLACWLFGFVITYQFWGGWAVAVGVFFLGVGVVPIGMLAALFKAEWQVLGILVLLTVLTLATRFGGVAISAHGSKEI